MKSVATRRFWELFRALPVDVQKLAVKNYHLWRQNRARNQKNTRADHGADNDGNGIEQSKPAWQL